MLRAAAIPSGPARSITSNTSSAGGGCRSYTPCILAFSTSRSSVGASDATRSRFASSDLPEASILASHAPSGSSSRWTSTPGGGGRSTTRPPPTPSQAARSSGSTGTPALANAATRRPSAVALSTTLRSIAESASGRTTVSRPRRHARAVASATCEAPASHVRTSASATAEPRSSPSACARAAARSLGLPSKNGKSFGGSRDASTSAESAGSGTT